MVRNRRRGGADDAGLTFVISVAAELAGMHPQTLRQYDRLGLVIPQRTKGRGRRYSGRDIQRLRQIQRLSQDEGINLEGIKRILDLERQVEHLEAECALMRRQLDELDERQNRVFTASPTGEVHPVRRGQRLGLRDADVARGEVALWRGIATTSPVYAPHRVRAVIEAGPAGVRVLEGSVRIIEA